MTTYLRPWKRISSEKIADCRVFTVHKQLASKACLTGEIERTHDFYVFHSGDWVNIIPTTEDNRVVLIEQYRHGTENITLEIPGGSVDADDDSPFKAAERELFEETGYQGSELIPLGSTHPNPAIQSNLCHTFLARNVKRLATPVFNSTEEIAIRLVSIADIPDLIRT
ncbi:MAG: NUDIX hydrolase, partial [Candidatus Obscuribacterales bacterium]|nr:NUDIX hydrolase [Candidatus Obscuribacterales bacterium]